MATKAAANEALILDFVEWVAAAPHTHRDVMETWRTSCPRLTVWEDAVDAGYVERVAGGTQAVRITPRGLELLKVSGRIGQPGRDR
ncbi:MAG TPA: hypothetical protein VJL90_06395 [Pseudorhodoplanes sp.]|nr:hypothetical protein [Pseudorhodoplanes sp.]